MHRLLPVTRRTPCFLTTPRLILHIRWKSTSSIRNQLHDVFQQAIKSAYPAVSTISRVDLSNQPSADYQCNNALALAKTVKATSQEVAEAIIQHLPKDDSIEKAYYSAPGYVNIEVGAGWLARRVNTIANSPNLGVSMEPTQKYRITVDYASPNMCKELHIGHLRSTILGDAIANILEYIGHNVERVSHVGDFGTPIGLVLTQAMDTNAEFVAAIDRGESKLPSVTELSELYVAAKQRSKTDAAFMKRATDTVVDLQQQISKTAGDKLLRAYHALCEASRQSYHQVFQRLGVQGLIERGESFYANMLTAIVSDLVERKIAVDSDGAKVVFTEGFKAPFIIEKSDGAHLYGTTDLAALRYRVNEGKQWLIYVTDDSQRQHFQQLFKVAKKAGWLDTIPAPVRVDHVSFGVIKDSKGLKFSSRDGAPYPLLTFLDDALNETSQVIHAQRELSKIAQSLTADEDKHIIEAVTYSAIKYFDISHPKDYIFTFNQMLSLKGNTALYVMYAYTRIRAVRRRASSKVSESTLVTLGTKEERQLALSIARFTDCITDLQRTLAPHHLCEYLADLASKFHVFYDCCRIIGDPQEESRLQLCVATEKVLWQGLTLLGLKPLEKI